MANDITVNAVQMSKWYEQELDVLRQRVMVAEMTLMVLRDERDANPPAAPPDPPVDLGLY